MNEISRIRYFRTGQLVRDIGIVSLYKFLKENYGNKIEIELTNNYLEFEEVNLKTFYKNLEKNIGYSFPYVGNSIRFGGNNGPKDESMYENLDFILKKSFDCNRKTIEQQELILDEYGISGLCSVCNNYVTTKTHYSVKNGLEERKEDKDIYSFFGGRSNTYNNYAKSNVKVCFTCELLHLFFLIYVKEYELNFLAHCDSLEDINYINYKILINHKLYNDNSLYVKLAKLNSKRLKIYNIKRDKSRLIVEYTNSFFTKDIIGKIRKIEIVQKYKFNVKDRRGLIAYIKRLIYSNNEYKAYEILLENIISNELDDKKKYTQTSENISLYIKFLEEGFEIMKNNAFYKTGVFLGQKVEEEKKKNITYRLTQLLKSDSRQGLFNELMHLLISYEIEIPAYYSDSILTAKSIDLHYNVGKLIEGFNKKGEQ
ncbi:MAG: hypothetical protein N4A57_15880 [Anaeromicrobium sp.]|uniref:hypothetical protein n=1 Tax=Anaeromicrobium sp. TaxID=1929132 RepID=UPI0025D0D6DA|nr:hypothetical protein [Anaeromicrobium sp.]MCT4595728.1 hypothetical protein [Anaeromicrobium sp.]